MKMKKIMEKILEKMAGSQTEEELEEIPKPLEFCLGQGP